MLIKVDHKTILITGGAGYIGSHACKKLASQGYTPIAHDNLIYGHKNFAKWGPFEHGNILDGERLRQVMVEYRPSAVFHFAAFGYVGESIQDPAKYYKNNVAGTISLLNAMKDCGINKIVFSSTCATYGIPESIPISENHIQHPINPYGQSKLFVEKILKDYDRAFGIKSVVFRYFNAAGADPDCEIGEDHDPESHLIPLIFDVAAGKRKQIEIFGDDYPTPDGTCIRDYIHVCDIAAAHVMALKHLEDTNKSDDFNLGVGYGYSVKEVIRAVEKVTGKPVITKVANRRAGDPAMLIADAAKARSILGWKPQYENLEIMVEHAWRWYQKRFGIRKKSVVLNEKCNRCMV
jgi:UDP-arabinose 4-epimerase